VLDKGPAAATEARDLINRLQPTLPVVLANLVSLEQVAVTYQPSLEQLLVLFPRDIEMLQAAQLANRDTKQDYKGLFLSFNLNANLPPPCTTGFLPAQQVRSPSEVDYPERPAGDMYCRVPQDSALDVRGARNAPCITRPGKRARRSRCVRATKTTFRSTTATTGKATQTPRFRASLYRSRLRERLHRPGLLPHHPSQSPRMTRPPAHTPDQTANSTPRQTSARAASHRHGKTFWSPTVVTDRSNLEDRVQPHRRIGWPSTALHRNT
jgi:hypothetical protein